MASCFGTAGSMRSRMSSAFACEMGVALEPVVNRGLPHAEQVGGWLGATAHVTRLLRGVVICYGLLKNCAAFDPKRSSRITT